MDNSQGNRSEQSPASGKQGTCVVRNPRNREGRGKGKGRVVGIAV